MHGEPLAEHAARVEAPAHGREVLDGVQRRRSAPRRMEVVRHDDVIAALARAHVAARVGGHRVEPGSRAADAGRELRRRRDHLRQELDHVDVERRVLGRRPCGDAGPQTEEEGATGRGMEQQREPRQSTVDAPRRAAALLLPVVDAQARHTGGVLDDAHGGHHTVAVADDATAVGDIDERERRREDCERQRGGCRDQRRPGPRAPGCHREVAGGDQEQNGLGAERGDGDDAADRRCGSRCEHVHTDGAAEAEAGRARRATEVAEHGAHRDRREPEGEHGERRLGRERRRVARAEGIERPRLDAVRSPQRRRTEQTRGRQRGEQSITEAARIAIAKPALVAGRARRAARQVDAEEHREGVDGALRHLAEHANDEHLVADSQEAGERELYHRAPRERAIHGAPLGSARERSRKYRQGDRAAQQVQRDADRRATREADGGNQPERRGENAEHRAERVAGIERGDRPAVGPQPGPGGDALHRRQRGAHRSGRRKKQQERAGEREHPLRARRRLDTDRAHDPAAERRREDEQDQAPQRDDQLAAGVPAHRPRARLDPRAERQPSDGEPAEERGDDGEHRGGLVAQPQRALLGPDDLVPHRGEPRRHHQKV